MTGEIEIGTWPHGPLHLFVPDAFYIVTASTLYKQRIFDTPDKLRQLQNTLFEVMLAYGWELQAWALFSNHYHFVARSPKDGTTLKRLIQRLHSQSARLVNEMDHTPGRRVWFQYWDTCLTYEKSYYARLNYVHNNPVKHGLVTVAEQYPFCSAAWFKANAPQDFRDKVGSFPCDRVNVLDLDC
ncbi:MAG: transposase [Clostridia bacterium]|nr:transposase [Clostridia bacterium]